jgi:hypothetical protein
MQRRLHRALRESSEFRAFIILVILWSIRAWRRLQKVYANSPSIIEWLERYRQWVNVKISYFLYKEVHWI